MAMDLSSLRDRPHAFSASGDRERLRQIWFEKSENIKVAMREFEERKLVVSTLPAKAIVELTQNCNFRCIMCPQSWDEKFAKPNPDFNMPMDTFVRIGEQLFQKAIFVDLRGFGETTILPYWPEIVDYLESHPFCEWHLVTNLALPRDHTWTKMIELGFCLGFSCDGATKETFVTTWGWCTTRSGAPVGDGSILFRPSRKRTFMNFDRSSSWRRSSV